MEDKIEKNDIFWQDFVKKIKKDFNTIFLLETNDKTAIQLELESQFSFGRSADILNKKLISVITIEKNGTIYLTKYINLHVEQFLLETITKNYPIDIHLGKYSYNDAYELLKVIFKALKHHIIVPNIYKSNIKKKI